MFPLIGADDAVGCEGGRTAMRMVNHDDVLYPEQMLCNGDGAQRIDGAPSGHDDGEHGRGRGYSIPRRVVNDLSQKYFVAQSLRYDVWDFSRPRIVAVDHQCPEWDCSGKGLSCGCFVKCWTRAEGVSIKLTHGCSSL